MEYIVGFEHRALLMRAVPPIAFTWFWMGGHRQVPVK